MTETALLNLLSALQEGGIRVVDLTQTLSPDFPTITLPPQFGQCVALKQETISRYDERGPGWYWNNFTCSEHTGTHFDAPIHWVTGKDLPNTPLPAHSLMHGSGRYGLQCLTNLDRLPVRGAVIIAAPLKLLEGSGSPLRVLALVPHA